MEVNVDTKGIAEITFSDGTCCHVEIVSDGEVIDVASIGYVKEDDEKNEQIKAYLEEKGTYIWNGPVTIKYPDNKIYNGLLIVDDSGYGKFEGIATISFTDKKNNVDRTLEACFSNGTLINDASSKQKIIYNENGPKSQEFEDQLSNGDYHETLFEQKIILNKNELDSLEFEGQLFYDDYHEIFKTDWEITGTGKLTFINYDVYKGNLEKGELNGQGTYTRTNGTIYEGEWEKGELKKGKKSYKKEGTLYEVDILDGKETEKVKITFANKDVYEGGWKNEKINGQGTYTRTNGTIYEGEWEDNKRKGRGKLTIVNKTTTKPLYTQIYNEDGYMEKVEYLFKEEEPNRKLIINYDRINRALDKGEINGLEDLKKYNYIYIADMDGNKIEDQSNCNIELIRQCAQYQMQIKLKGENNELDNEDRISGSYTGLENLIILSQTIDNTSSLRKTRFEISQNNLNWPNDAQQNIESYLNSLGLSTKDELPENSNLTSINILVDNGVNYFSVNMTTDTNDHAVSGIVDLKKIKEQLEEGKTLEELKDVIYVYDSSRVIGNPKYKGNLGGLQSKCQFYNHEQQKLGSCWYNAACSVITATKHPEMVDKISRGEISPISIEDRIPNENTKFNDFEVLQMLKLQEVAKNLGVERLGSKTKEQKFTKAGNRPRMAHQIINEDTRDSIKKFNKEYKLPEMLGVKIGTHKILKAEARDKKLLRGDSKTVTAGENEITEAKKDWKNRLAELNMPKNLLDKDKSDKEITEAGEIMNKFLLSEMEKSEKFKSMEKEEQNKVKKKTESLGFFTKREILKKTLGKERQTGAATMIE